MSKDDDYDYLFKARCAVLRESLDSFRVQGCGLRLEESMQQNLRSQRQRGALMCPFV